MADTVAALGDLSPSELEAMRSLSKQRLPIQSKHVEQLLAYIDEIRKEAREEVVLMFRNTAEEKRKEMGLDPIFDTFTNSVAFEVNRALKEE